MGAGLWLIIPFPHQVEVSFLKDGFRLKRKNNSVARLFDTC